MASTLYSSFLWLTKVYGIPYLFFILKIHIKYIFSKLLSLILIYKNLFVNEDLLIIEYYKLKVPIILKFINK